MTTIYAIYATHPTVPGTHSHLAFSVEERDRICMDKLEMIAEHLADDLEIDALRWNGKRPPDFAWGATLFALQAYVYSSISGRPVNEVLAEYLGAEDHLDAIVANGPAGFAIDVIEHNAVIPSNIPGRLPETVTIWTLAEDSDAGTCATIFASEREAEDHLLGAVNSSREEFDEWVGTRAPGADDDIYAFIDPKRSAMDTYSIDYEDVELASLLDVELPVPDVAVVVDFDIVKGVLSRDGLPVRVTIVDYNTEDVPDDHLVTVTPIGSDDPDGKKIPAYAMTSGVAHETGVDEAFWQAIVGDPIGQPRFSTTWVSIITDSDLDPRVSIFRTQAEREADLRSFYDEMRDDDDPFGLDAMDEGEIRDLILEHISGARKVTLTKTALAER